MRVKSLDDGTMSINWSNPCCDYILCYVFSNALLAII